MSKFQGLQNSPLVEPTGTQGIVTNPDFLIRGFPAQTYRSNFPPFLLGTAAFGNTALAATGVGLAVAIPLQQGDVISNISFITATTAAGTPTHQYVALYDNSATPVLLATSGDKTSTARAANTLFTVPLTTQVVISTAAIYYASISFTATTVPTLLGGTAFNVADTASILGSPILAQSHGTALAGIAPATIASPTTVTTVPFVILT